MLLLLATPLVAQQESGSVRAAAATITAADVERRLRIIADDSMGGRDTPSEGLEKTARYVADEFRRFGLKPGGEHGTYFQRYGIETRKFDAAASHLTLDGPASHVTLSFDRQAIYYAGTLPGGPLQADLVVVGGTLPPAQLDTAMVRNKIVLVVVDYSHGPPSIQPLYTALFFAGARATVRVSNREPAEFASRLANGAASRRTYRNGETGSDHPFVEIGDASVAGLGLDLAAIRGGDARLRPIPGGRGTLTFVESPPEPATAPNTIGILEGSDPKLKAEYMIFSAHMDHLGIAGHGSGDCQAVGADSICNGADDDGSGTTGVLEVAEAFSRRGVRPKRSMIFMTVSGEEKGLWGSAYFTEHPTVPLPNIVADFNVDMIGRNWEDTVVAIGRQHSNLGQILDATAARHPELHMVPVDDRWPEEHYYRRSDHFNFARQGVPVLFFFTGSHPDYHQASDEVPKIGFAKEARILQLLFYTSYAVAQGTERPRWDPESYEQIVIPAAKAARAGH
ncbi:MAG: M20/M25/M40 family metallo-hydrolase [Gemmatimonadetes bacterium]|nr:M20/M25/M40 family metallo-hydrolase [Gemmatimonadota bacterium]